MSNFKGKLWNSTQNILPINWEIRYWDSVDILRARMCFWNAWCYQVETFSALLALCVGTSPVTGEFPSPRPVTRLNKRLGKQSWGWWFETPSRPLWRHSNGALISLSCKLCFCLSIKFPKLIWSDWPHGYEHSKAKAKTAAILQTTFSNVFSWLKMLQI